MYRIVVVLLDLHRDAYRIVAILYRFTPIIISDIVYSVRKLKILSLRSRWL